MRLVRSWQSRLPGAAMLALERACSDLPIAPIAPAPSPASDAEGALERGLRRRGERARAALRDVRGALADGRLDVARHALDAARDVATPLGPAVRAWIALFDSELACAGGDVAIAALHSCAAEESARAAGDATAFLAIWWARAVRALRRGDGGRGELMARWMDAWLGQVSPRARARLHCFAAAFALDDDRADDAIDIAAAIVGSAPGTVEAALCGSIVTQAFITLDRVNDAARVATSSIERCPDLPPRIAARLYLDAAAALDAAGATELAARCAALADRLDANVATATSATAGAGASLEARLL